MNRMAGATGGDQTPGGSPVPDWFGRGEERSQLPTASGGFGCIGLLFALAIAGAAAIYGMSSDARAKKSDRQLAECRGNLAKKESELRESERMRSALAIEAQARPTATAVPTPTATATEETPEPHEGKL